jgi:hypothetical protein
MAIARYVLVQQGYRDHLNLHEVTVETKAPGLSTGFVGPLSKHTGSSERLTWKKVFSHDTSGGAFASTTDALSKNSEDPTAALYSVLDTLETLRLRDGSLHLKLCYPELAGDADPPCNEWHQTSNPVTESAVTGFEAVRLGFPVASDGGGDWSGLALSVTSPSLALIDDSPASTFWYFAIGATDIGANPNIPGVIPGPRIPDGWVKKVELYAELPGERLFINTACLQVHGRLCSPWRRRRCWSRASW